MLAFAAVVDGGGEGAGGSRSPDWVTDLRVADAGKCTALVPYLAVRRRVVEEFAHADL